MNKSVMIICDKEICIGCGVCENVCSSRACILRYDNEGFLAPIIDENKCNGCNLCKKKCPALLSMNNKIEQKGYAYYTKDDDLRKNSSSGGVFSDIAKFVIEEKNGVVVGAAYTNQDNNSHYLKHCVIHNMNDLYRLRGSKYLQSDTREIFKQVKDLLNSGKCVLFSGTPCQVSAIKSYIGHNDNLFTVDLFCHGVPSPKVFYKYLEEMDVKNDTYVNFKDKSIGWNDSCITYKTNSNIYKVRHSQDTYYLGFVDNLYLRKSCHSCKFNLLENRPADISIGDFWEVENQIKELNDDIGVSAVITNTERGNIILEHLSKNAGYCKQVDICSIVKGNGVLQAPVKVNKLREKFFNEYNYSGNFLKSARDNLNIGDEVLILNHSYSHNNYGAMMVAYSMEQIVEKLGYKSKTLLFSSSMHSDIFDSFKRKYLNTTDEYDVWDYKKLKKLNKEYKTFIVGSDQVWRNWDYNSNLYRWYLDFTDDTKNLISYAASFGFDYFDDRGVSKNIIKKLLKSYSAISVREKSGVEICKKYFNADAQWVIDPTQLLESADYEKIIEGDCAKPPCDEPYLAYMIFPEDENASESTYSFINKIAEELKLKPIPLLTNNGAKQKTVGEWLATIKNASFIITESFHGTMFSLIFKTPMLVLALDATERNRLPSFFEHLGILQNRILYSLDESAAISIANEIIDWEEVYKKRRNFQQESLDFLCTALSKQIISNGRKNNGELIQLLLRSKRIVKRILPKFIKEKLKIIYSKIKR